MKKIWLLLLAIFLSACTPDYSYSVPESVPEGIAEDFILEEASFHSAYYNTLGEEGLQKLSENAQILCLLGRHGSLLYANTPTRMLFIHETDESIWQLMEYNKVTGQFAPACPDVMCSHDTCLFSQTYKIFAGEHHLFFHPHMGEASYYMSELDGTNLQTLSLPADAFLHTETEKGLYWEKTELKEEHAYYSLWLYSFSDGENRQLAPPAENVTYHVATDGVYIHDIATLTLYKIDSETGEKQKVAEDIISLSNFGGYLYDYDYNTGTFRKLVGDQMVIVARVDGVYDYWVSEGYLYFFCEDKAYMESVREDKELYQYLSRDNPTCGNIYRIKEGGDTPQLLCRIVNDGKPALIDHMFADGEVVYIQCRDYESFPNRYNDERGDPTLVILDATNGEFLEIPN